MFFWPKMDDFSAFFVNFVQKKFIFGIQLFKKSQFPVQISCTGTKNVQNRQKSRKKKMNTKCRVFVLVQEICTENGLFLKQEGPKTSISVLAVVEFWTIFDVLSFLDENGPVFSHILNGFIVIFQKKHKKTCLFYGQKTSLICTHF